MIGEAVTDGLVHPTCGGADCAAGSPSPTHAESCPLYDRSRLLRQVTVTEQRDALLRAMMVAPVRALQLLKRVPETARSRGWPDDFDSHCVIAAAVGAYKLGAEGQRFRLPSALLATSEWFALAARALRGRPSASEIVEGFSLEHLLQPA